MTTQSIRSRGPHRRHRAAASVAVLALVVAAVFSGGGAPATARADSWPANPADPKTPPTAAIDRLATVQHNGVAWNQVMVGNTVYVAGRFTAARPAGSPAGQNQVTRNNMLAFDLLTGALKTSFNPNLNGQALSVAAAPDGSRIYVGGEFTSVGGTPRSRIAALDPVTGALITSFNVGADNQVKSIVATASTVYLGGLFTRINNTSRARIAAVRATDGGLITTFAPVMTGSIDSSPRVNAMTLSPDGTKLVIGGNFVTLNGSNRPGYGLGMVNPTTGASLPLPINDLVRNAGKDAAILSLSSDGVTFYGTGYVFGGGGNLEGAFAANWSDGRVKWIEDCRGDSYSVYSSSTAVYVAGHPHQCLNLGGYPETQPPMRAVAFSKAATGVLLRDPRTNYNREGQPAPSLLNFFPLLPSGTVSGQGQGAWSVVGSGSYVVFAGEFPSVNGVGQQGIVRFATREIAPNKMGPRAVDANFTPTISSPASGQVRLIWPANYDNDNSTLTYAVLRDNLTTPVGTLTRDSVWWSRPAMTFTDTGVPGGQHSYRVRASDPFGNSVTSPAVSITIAGPANAAPVASFTASVSGRTVTVNASASSDPDGSISAYQWSWGDGSTGSGATASHTYAADNTYVISLTVVDNAGAQGSTTRTVQVGDPSAAFGSDTFSRTVASGFGTADRGGAWSTSGSGFSVNGSEGVVSVGTAGQGPWAQLPGVSSVSTDLTAGVRLDRRVNTGAAFFGTIGRRVGSADYRLKLRVDPAGAVTVSAIRLSGGETALASAPVAGLTYPAGAQLKTRLQVSGTSPTTIRGKVWLSTQTEPAAWQVTASDSTAGLQTAGSVGVFTYISGSATNSPWVFRFDDVVAKPVA